MKRVAIIGAPNKPTAAAVLERVRQWLAGRATVVYAGLSVDSSTTLHYNPELIVVLGGDGTLIGVVHGLGERQVPILGVNLGKLGYMAEFTPDQLEREGDFLFADGLTFSRRLMLDVTLARADGTELSSLAVNDCVVLAGMPFRMIELRLESDGDEVATVRGDGLVVATPSGSTAHNLSAGGPILEPTAAAFILTPLCPHALTFRPLVVDARRVVEVRLLVANEGTNVSIDGQRNWSLRAGDRLRVRRYAADFLLVRNPAYSVWSGLRRKLMWGAGPGQSAG